MEIIFILGDIDMLNALRPMAFGFIAIVASIVALDVRPACAQPETPDSWTETHVDPYEIGASDVGQYAGYYSPYAIMAAATHLPVARFEEIKGLNPADGADVTPDVKYAVEGVFPDEIAGPKIRPIAQAAFKAWRYQFGSDAESPCFDPKDEDCKRLVRKDRQHLAGPTFQVWARVDLTPQPSTLFGLLGPTCAEFSIAFEGTRENSRMDWLSNGRFFGTERLFHLDSSYTWLHRNINAIIRTIAAQPCYRVSSPPLIVSVGHSLGGGLAVHAALANDPNKPRIEKVFAFEPSPETGADLVEQKTLMSNRKGLEIDRVDHLGEASSKLEGWAQWARTINWNSEEFYPPAGNRCNDKLLVRKVHVQAFVALKKGLAGDIELHTMAPLAAELITLNGREAVESRGRPRAPSDCPTRYDARKHIQELQEATPIPAQISNLSPAAVVAPAQSPAVVGPSQSPAVVAPPQTQVTEFGPQRQLYARAQTQFANPDQQRQSLFAPVYALAADLGARGALRAPVQTQIAGLDHRQALFPPPSAQAANLSARRALYEPAQTELADLDQRQTLSPPARTKAADIGARRVHYAPSNTEVADLTDRGVRAARQLVADVPTKAAATPTDIKSSHGLYQWLLKHKASYRKRAIILPPFFKLTTARRADWASWEALR